MNPALEKLKGLEARYLYMILFGIMFLLALLDFAVVMRLQLGLAASLDSRIEQLRKDITDLSTNKQRQAQFATQLGLARTARKNFEAMVHRKDDVPAVLNSISNIANEYKVKIDQLTPQPVSPTPLIQNEDGKYYAMTINVRINCGFHQFGRFINRLERERLFWQLDDFGIMADPKDITHQEVKMNMKILILEK
ncbi:MAG: type 4a pilus biogenesis protein PilO [Candidatus Omnitrophota bacterium]